MTDTALFYYNDQLGKVVPRCDVFQFNITAAKTVSPAVANSATLTAFDAIASQAVINTFLGTTDEFLVAAFDATAMGTDAFAFILNLNGQARTLCDVKVRTYSGTGGGTVVERCTAPVATLTASTLSTQCALGAYGNVAARSVLTGVDVLTSGIIEVSVYWIAK